MSLVLAMLLKVVLLCFLTGSVVALLFGIGLLLRSELCLRMNTYMSRWISTRKLVAPLEVERDTQRVVYRHHRLVGVVLAVGATYVLTVLAGMHDPKPLVEALNRGANPRVVEVYVRTAYTLLVIGNVVALAVGAVLVLRPSLLKGMETWTNRTVSLRRFGRVLETINSTPDQVVATYPRAAGTLIVLASLFIIASLGTVLYARW